MKKVIWFTSFHHSIYDPLLEKLAKENIFDVSAVVGYENNIKYNFKKIILPEKSILGLKHAFVRYFPKIRENKKIGEGDIFIINYYSSIASFQIYKIAKKRNIALLVATEEKERKGFFKKIILDLWDATFGKKILNYAEVIMPWTKSSLSFIESKIKDKGKIHPISAGIDTSLFFPKERKGNSQKINILMVARFEKTKDHHTLLKSIHHIKKNNLIKKQLCLTLIGGGPLKNKILKMVLKEIKILEFVENKKMNDVYGAHDLLILPSKSDPVGMVVLEAMACGLPVIVSDGVGAKDFVIENKNGFIFKAGDYIDLANKIIKISSMDITEMGNNAALHIKENYDIEKTSNHVLKIIKKAAH